MVFVRITPSQKLTTTQIVERFPAFLWNTMANERFHTSPPSISVLNQYLTAYVIKITPMFALRMQLDFPSWLFPSGVTN
jgi:hypothetical protein